MKKLSLILLALIALTQTAWAQDVNYIECSWTGSNTGGHVVQTTRTLADGSYTTLANNSGEYPSLSGGWYVVASNCVYMSRIVINGNVNIVVMDGTELYCVQGIQIKDGCTLTIYAQSDGDGMGSVECHGGDVHNGNGDDAALGGNRDEVGGYLVIHGGNIWAHANHNNAAGIGGGNHKSGMRGVTIWGGIIDAYGKNSGAGIGAGQQNEVATPVTIYGGTITAKSKRYGAGIGGGEDCGNGTIKIYGGTVNATGGQCGAGIGGGQGGSMGNTVYIYGGTVTATGGNCGAGIGGGENDKGGGNQEAAVYIYGGNVTAKGGQYAAGIGGGDEGSGGPVYIYGGTVNASCSEYGAGIGGGYSKSNGTIRIYGGTVTADAGDMEVSGAGIGAGCAAQMEYPVYIHGGTVKAYSGAGAAIGGGGRNNTSDEGMKGGAKDILVPSHNYSQIVIYGGNVYAETRQSECAAIGAGSDGDGGTIKIYGGYVETQSYSAGASIGATGGVDEGDCHTNIQIYGGTVKAHAPSRGNGECIGVAYDDNPTECYGTIILGDNMKVYKSSDGTTAASSDRESACRSQSGYVIVSECDHAGASFVDKDDDKHHLNCTYCNGYDDDHIYGTNTSNTFCTVCNHEATGYSIYLYKSKEDGSGYDEGTHYIKRDGTYFSFSSCSDAPNDMSFVGWIRINSAPESSESIELQESEIGNLTDDGFNVHENRYYKARYKNLWAGQGSGTETNPYIVSSIADLTNMSTVVNKGHGYEGKYFIMTNDIEYDGTENNYTAIGTNGRNFRGNFDGQGFSISGINLTSDKEDVGVFGDLRANATVKNLTLTNSTITAKGYVGGIVGLNRGGTIENCHVTSSVTIQDNGDSVSENFGGIAGSSYGIIYGCTSAANVNGKARVGGVVGNHYGPSTGDLEHCLYLGNNVTGHTGDQFVGAIIGRKSDAKTTASNYYVPWSGGPRGYVLSDNSNLGSMDKSGEAEAGYTVTTGTNGLTLDFGEATTTYDNGIRVYGFGLYYDGVLYSGNGQQVTFTPQARGYLVSDIQANGDVLSPNSDGSYTITMGTANVSITAATLTPAVTRIVDGYGSSNDKWAFIASPLASDIAPSAVSGLVGTYNSTTGLYNYDLYRLNPSNTMWENYHQHYEDATNPFNVLVNGQGYLYARKQRTELVFVGTFNEGTTKTVTLSPGWNLVGNPFTDVAYVNRPFYQMNDDGSAIVAIDTYNDYTPIDIPACTGIIVHAESDSETVTFSTTEPELEEANNNQGSLRITLSQVDAGRKTMGRGAMLDNAIVSFNEGSQLGKFYFGTQNANIYIPQGGEEYAIVSVGNGRDAARHVSTNEIPINFKAKENGTYTLSVNPQGVEMGYLHLIDNMTGADVDLLALRQAQGPASYTFQAKTTDYESRFKLVFGASTSSATEGTFAFISNGNIVITNASAGAVLQIVDMMGRVIVSREGDAINRVSTSGMAPGVYVLRLIDGDSVRTQKIVVR